MTTPYKHDASDKKLDAEASAESDAAAEKSASSANHDGHNHDDTSKHNDTGKDRMFEGREQHDKANVESEKNRLAKDQAKHNHPVEGEGVVTESNMHVKKKD